MNQAFEKLPAERKLQIINGAMGVFAAHFYKQALTDDIAAAAGISKGLLFYYFENKIGLYQYLYEYSARYIMERLAFGELGTQWDFFELLLEVQNTKLKMMKTHPYLFAFLRKSYYEPEAKVKAPLAKVNSAIMAASSQAVLGMVDKSKFKDGIEPSEVLTLVWCFAEGFLNQKLKGAKPDLDALCEEFAHYLTLLRDNFYKEEVLL